MTTPTPNEKEMHTQRVVWSERAIGTEHSGKRDERKRKKSVHTRSKCGNSPNWRNEEKRSEEARATKRKSR